MVGLLWLPQQFGNDESTAEAAARRTALFSQTKSRPCLRNKTAILETALCHASCTCGGMCHASDVHA